MKNRFQSHLQKRAGPLARPLAKHEPADVLHENFDTLLGNLDGLDFDDEDLLGQLALQGPKSTALPLLPSMDMEDWLDVNLTPTPKPFGVTQNSAPGFHLKMVDKVSFEPKRPHYRLGPLLSKNSFEAFNKRYGKACRRVPSQKRKIGV